MSLFTQGFFRGLRVVLPLAITFSVIYWVAALLEMMLGRWLKMLLPDSLSWIYWKGAGVALSLVAIFLVGLLFFLPPVRALFRGVEKVLSSLPVVRSIYGPSRDLVHFLFDVRQPGNKRFSKVVMLTLPGVPLKVLGLITRDDLSSLPAPMEKRGEVLVYLPMSYQLGGYMVLVQRSSLEPVEMSVEEALRFTMTAGMSGESNGNGHPHPAKPPKGA